MPGKVETPEAGIVFVSIFHGNPLTHTFFCTGHNTDEIGILEVFDSRTDFHSPKPQNFSDSIFLITTIVATVVITIIVIRITIILCT